MAASIFDLYPNALYAPLREAYVGKTLLDVAGPAAVLDRAVVERNCRAMLEACDALQVSFRSHVKTHKVRNGILVFAF